MYVPSTGRFMSRDPLPATCVELLFSAEYTRQVFGRHRMPCHSYVYSDSNPTNLTDPSGLAPGTVTIDPSCVGLIFVVPRDKDSVWVNCFPDGKPCDADGVFLGPIGKPEDIDRCAFYKVGNDCHAVVKCYQFQGKPRPYIDKVTCDTVKGRINQECRGGCVKAFGRPHPGITPLPPGFDPKLGPYQCDFAAYPDLAAKWALDPTSLTPEEFQKLCGFQPVAPVIY